MNDKRWSSDLYDVFSWSVHWEAGAGAAQDHGVRFSIQSEDAGHLHSHPAWRGRAAEGVLDWTSQIFLFLISAWALHLDVKDNVAHPIWYLYESQVESNEPHMTLILILMTLILIFFFMCVCADGKSWHRGGMEGLHPHCGQCKQTPYNKKCKMNGLQQQRSPGWITFLGTVILFLFRWTKPRTEKYGKYPG